MDLKNKVVVITGGSKGLGRALASGFLKEQVRVIINAPSKKEVEEVGKEIGAATFAGDVTKESDMNNLASFAVEKFGAIDIWINNAGIWLPHAPVEETDYEKVNELMEVNLFGTIYG